MEKLIFFGLVIPILFFVLYLGTRAIMSGVSAKQANQANKDENEMDENNEEPNTCLLYTSPSPRDQRGSRMPSSA